MKNNSLGKIINAWLNEWFDFSVYDFVSDVGALGLTETLKILTTWRKLSCILNLFSPLYLISRTDGDGFEPEIKTARHFL